ncbi:MAG: hypothetical protein MJ052_01825 [Sphaerochaetaceae bacterium]|nr:hypothetical protein [Sphaerochaetaceae bacterium]
MKIKNNKFDSFLGVSSANGFYGYFQLLGNDPDLYLYLLKSGPGCGKSSLMKEIASTAIDNNQAVELIHCSSDPESLDGVILWDKKIAILDATSPHSVEPTTPGMMQDVISLYHTINKEKLIVNKNDLIYQAKRYKYYHKQSGSSLANAAGLLRDNLRTASIFYNDDKISNYANNLAEKIITVKDDCSVGHKYSRFLSAITPRGIIFYDDSLRVLAEQIYVIEDEYGVCSNSILKTICNYAVNAGNDVFCCGCPLLPEEKTDFLIIPDLSLAFVTSNSWHKPNFPKQNVIDSQEFVDKKLFEQVHSQLEFNQGITKQIVEQSIKLQQQAMKSHDKMEEYYNPAVDFDEVNKVRQNLLKEIFG